MRAIHGISTVALVVLLGACGGARRAEVGTATLTSGPSYQPGAVELYTARQEGTAGCGLALAPTIQFDVHTDAMLPGEERRLATWAECLKRPNLAHTTVVLVGGDDSGAPPGLFAARAKRIRDGLVANGVAPERVLVGAPSAAREGGRLGPTSSVSLELTTSEAVRALGRPQPPPVTTGVGFGLR